MRMNQKSREQRMMMNRKRQLALVVVACFVGAGLLSLVPMGKPWQSQNTSTTNGKTFSFCNGFHAYVVVETSSLPKGVVAKLTITSCVPIDWLAWGIAIVAVVALVIVSILLAKKK